MTRTTFGELIASDVTALHPYSSHPNPCVSLLQRRLRRCPGQKCSHQEAEQTFPEPDPRQEGVPGVGAHEMCQSQKCKCVDLK